MSWQPHVKAGGKVVLSREPVWTMYPAQTFRSFWDHQVRWARTVRLCRPLSYMDFFLRKDSVGSARRARCADSVDRGHVSVNVLDSAFCNGLDGWHLGVEDQSCAANSGWCRCEMQSIS